MASHTNFRCRIKCQPKFCKYEECKCLGEVKKSATFLKTVLDLAKTLCQIMVLCNIDQGKAKATIDVTTRAFLHFDEVRLCADTKPKKRLRTEDVFQGLGKRCMMDREEAHMAFVIIKYAFKAFYYEGSSYKPTVGEHTLFCEGCAYVHAAKRTAQYYAHKQKLTCAEYRAIGAEIETIYRNIWTCVHACKHQAEDAKCNCCFCAKTRRHLSYGDIHPCEAVPKVTLEPPKCPVCCAREKPMLVPAGRFAAKCPRCHRPHRFCICQKIQFDLDYVQSIWSRKDFETYRKSKIDPYPGQLPVIEMLPPVKETPALKEKPAQAEKSIRYSN